MPHDGGLTEAGDARRTHLVQGLERWTNKVAVVTGASSGIGRAIALRLAKEGVRVWATGRSEEALKQLADTDERIVAHPLDLRDVGATERMFEAVRASVGGVDIMVNNAGLGHAAPLTGGDTEQWREMLEVNVLALCVCTREAVADMTRRGAAGHIFHVSSMAAHRVPPGSGVYSATKYAVRSLTESLRQELRAEKSPIRVTALSPGFVETEFAVRYHKRAEAADEAYGRYPVLQPEDVAEALVYALAQPDHVQVHDVLMRPTEQLS
ncbi:MAG: SDR family NAD(P)-dependent oxidoreductase [Myxococcota bacterium]